MAEEQLLDDAPFRFDKAGVFSLLLTGRVSHDRLIGMLPYMQEVLRFLVLEGSQSCPLCYVCSDIPFYCPRGSIPVSVPRMYSPQWDQGPLT